MHPVILQVSSFTIYSWGLMIAVGFELAILYFFFSIKKEQLPLNFILNLIIGIIVFSILGARILHVLMHLPYYMLYPLRIIRLWEGGMTLQGGLIFSISFSIYYIKTHHLPLDKIADCAAPAIAFGFSVGRIGCFLNGCCYGVPSSFGFVFPRGSPAGEFFSGQTLFPTQLISSLNLLIMGIVLHLLRKKNIARDRLLPLFLILYSVHRFLIEFLRGDTFPVAFNLTSFQIISIILALFSFIWWKTGLRFSYFFLAKKKKT